MIKLETRHSRNKMFSERFLEKSSTEFQLVKIKVQKAPCGVIIRFRNPVHFCWWNPEARSLEHRIQSAEKGNKGNRGTRETGQQREQGSKWNKGNRGNRGTGGTREQGEQEEQGSKGNKGTGEQEEQGDRGTGEGTRGIRETGGQGRE